MTGNANPTTPVKIGDIDYNLNSVDLAISYNTLAPYLGLGWDTTFGDRDNWGFVFDLGLIYSGSAEAALTAKGPGTSAAFYEENRKKEQDELQSELDSLKWWPVISAGVVYQF